MEKIKIIIRKEWAEVFKNKMVFFTVVFLPLFFTLIPLVIIYFTGGIDAASAGEELPASFIAVCPPGSTSGECFQIYILLQFLILYMILPLIIPVNIAAYSIVGEKTTRSLEPLLATPISIPELLIGKNLSAAIPAVFATLAGFIIYLLGAWIITGSQVVLSALLQPMWILAIVLVGPLLAILSVNFAMMISSRVNDPRVAEQLSAIVVVPVLVLFFGQITGFFLLNQVIVLLLALFVLLLDIVMISLAVRLFQRETILTRWR
jgi:ABC-2 type transport system permease protein